jgi:hypothetical protein
VSTIKGRALLRPPLLGLLAKLKRSQRRNRPADVDVFARIVHDHSRRGYLSLVQNQSVTTYGIDPVYWFC